MDPSIGTKPDTRPRGAAPTRNRYGAAHWQTNAYMREMAPYLTDLQWVHTRYLQAEVYRAYLTSD
jgi:hypothetical protein